MPLKFKKLTELEITDKAFEIVKTKIDKGEYNNYEELLDDLAKLLKVFPHKDRIKAIAIIGVVVIAITFIAQFVG
jgi:t-SNARE complex subunit (syntaxin)